MATAGGLEDVYNAFKDFYEMYTNRHGGNGNNAIMDTPTPSRPVVGHKRPRDFSPNLFSSPDMPSIPGISATPSDSGSALVTENRSGNPIRAENANIHGGDHHYKQLRTVKTVYQMKVDNTSSTPFYIPWESMCVHPYESLREMTRNVFKWRPYKATVKFDTGRAFLKNPGTNALELQKEAGDWEMLFFAAGEQSPIHATVFQSKLDADNWYTQSYGEDGLVYTNPPTRHLYTGFDSASMIDVTRRDPCWMTKIAGRDTFGFFEWEHNLHMDSPWRLPRDYLCNNDIFYKDSDRPWDKIFNWDADAEVELFTYPRFDYLGGYIYAPHVNYFTYEQRKKINNLLVDQTNVVNNKAGELLFRDFEKAYYDNVFEGVQTMVNNDIDNYADASPYKRRCYKKFNQVEGFKNQKSAPYPTSYVQHYFENHLMKPIYFWPNQLLGGDGNSIPITVTFNVTIEHTFEVLLSRREGYPENIYRKYQTAAKDHILFDDPSMNKDDLKTIYYFTDIYNQKDYVDQNCSFNVYIPKCYPLVVNGIKEI